MLGAQPLWVKRLDELHLLTPLRVLVTLLVALVLTKFVTVFIRRLVDRTIGVPGLDRARNDFRRRGLASALRGVLLGVIWTAAAVTAVSELGVNIGAFVATATVVGGAIGFGAQQMVRDMVAGAFVLGEDQYGVGDEIDVGLAAGTVERITLHSVRLRDGTGAVWYVPHGWVTRTANLSRATVARYDVDVARTSDAAAVTTELTAIAGRLAADTTVAAKLAGPPRVAGLISIRDDRLVWRLEADVQAGSVDSVRRRLRELVLDGFSTGALAAPPNGATTVYVENAPPSAAADD